ncbi:Dolichyl-diphosphooligosaccharide--protein glycosyltransferase subunit Swp1 [Zopfochytrium polystomum]|nr:Dolichyl-diphosphooligosaccharide--protein glycosyltransferase subunit Swp1 [Zopfochytrium polystomum]
MRRTNSSSTSSIRRGNRAPSARTASILLCIALIVAALFAVVAPAPAAAASIDQVAVKITQKDGSKKTSASATFPSPMAKELSLAPTDALTIALQISAKSSDNDDLPLAQQVVLALSGASTEATAVIEAGSNGRYELVLDLARIGTLDSVKNNPGTYEATVYVSGGNFGTPVAYRIATVTVTGSSDNAAASVDKTYAPKPEIHHVFRPDEKMPPVALSQLFSLLVLAPWGLLAILWLSIGVNVSNLFASASNFFWGTSFIVSLAATLGLYYVYWLQLNMFQFLGYGTVLWFVTAAIGWRALVARAAFRLK